MTKEQLKKALENLSIWCVTKNITRKGKISEYTIKHLMDVFEAVGFEKISGIGYQECKVTNKKFTYYLEDKKINSFIGCDSICGYMDLTFRINFQNKYNINFKVNECLIIDFE